MLSEDLEAALEVLTTLLTKPLDIFGGDQMLLLQFLGFRKKNRARCSEASVACDGNV